MTQEQRDIVEDLDLKLDAEQAALSKCQADVTAWQRVPTWMRIVLVTSSMLGTLSCYMIFVASSYAFADFTIVDDPATVLCLFEQRMDAAEWAAVGSSGPPPVRVVTSTPQLAIRKCSGKHTIPSFFHTNHTVKHTFKHYFLNN